MKPNPVPPEYKRYKTLEEANEAEEEEMKRLQKILDSGFFSEPTHITDIAQISGSWDYNPDGISANAVWHPKKRSLFGRMVEWVKAKFKI